MSTQDIENETGCAPKSALAANEHPTQNGPKPSSKGRLRVKPQTVQRCLKGDERAWERLYRQCHPRLRRAIELLLGTDASDAHVVEEIAARVWYALLRDNCRLLAAYDADRDSSLDVFLMGLARIEILRYTRSERRRQSHEMLGGRSRLQEQRVSDWQLAAMMDEFVSALTPGEREFLERFLTGPVEPGDNGNDQDISATNAWQRRHRIRFKLTEFLKSY